MRCLLAWGFFILVASSSAVFAEDDPVAARGEVDALLDPNNDGFTSDKEAEQAFQTITRLVKRRTPAGKRMLGVVDRSGNGKVEPIEILAVIAERRQQDGGVGEFVAKTFERFDTNVDGYLTPDEYERVIKGLSLTRPNAAGRLAAALRKMDINGNRNISRLEAMLGAETLARELNQRIRGLNPQHEAAMDRAIEVIKELDKNADEIVSKREATKNDRLKAVFASVDADRDKSLTRNEIFEYLKHQLMLQARQQRARETREGRKIRDKTLREIF